MAEVTTVTELSDKELDAILLDIFCEETDLELDLHFNKDFSQETLDKALTLRKVNLKPEESNNAYDKIQKVTEDLMDMLLATLLKNKKLCLSSDGDMSYDHSDLVRLEFSISKEILVDLLDKMNKKKS